MRSTAVEVADLGSDRFGGNISNTQTTAQSQVAQKSPEHIGI